MGLRGGLGWLLAEASGMFAQINRADHARHTLPCFAPGAGFVNLKEEINEMTIVMQNSFFQTPLKATERSQPYSYCTVQSFFLIRQAQFSLPPLHVFLHTYLGK